LPSTETAPKNRSKKIVDEQIADLLEQADGVAQASVRGGRSAIVRIELDQNRLEAYGLTLPSIARGLSSQNIEVGGGSVSESTKKYTVRTTGGFESIDDINHSVVGTYNGYDVKLEDIGTASMGYSDVTSKIYINGKHGVYVSVQKQSGSNTVNVAKAVKEKIKEIEKTLPTDINIEIISDDSTSVSDTLTELIKSIVQGFILSVIVLFIFLRSGRSTFIMAISIPFCILITLTAMSFAGNLTIICVFIPFFVFKNKLEMLGQMFSSLMSVILIAILSSLFVAVFLVPVLAGKFLPVSNRKEHPIKNAFLAKCDKRIENALNWLTAQYQKGLHFVLRRRFATVVIAFGIFAASLVLIGRLNISFMSNYNDSSVSLNVTLPLGTKLEETQAILDDFYQFAQNEIKGYDNIVVSIGSGSGGGMSDTSYQGSLTVYLPDASKQIDNAQTVKEKLRAHFDSYPAATLSFNEGMMQQMSGNDINIVFRSSDLDASVALAKKIQALIKEQLPAVTEPQIDMQDGLPQVEIKVDRERAYSFSISIMSIANEINYEVQECARTHILE